MLKRSGLLLIVITGMIFSFNSCKADKIKEQLKGKWQFVEAYDDGVDATHNYTPYELEFKITSTRIFNLNLVGTAAGNNLPDSGFWNVTDPDILVFTYKTGYIVTYDHRHECRITHISDTELEFETVNVDPSSDGKYKVKCVKIQ